MRVGGLEGVTVAGAPLAELATGLAAVAALLLVPAGIAKLRDPARARTALGWGGRAGGLLLRGVGAGELVLAAGVLLLGGPIAHAVLGATYLAFAVVAARQRAAGADCGCFGGPATAPTGVAHVAVNVGAALVAGAAALLAAPAAVTVAVALGPAAAILGVLLVAATVSVHALLTASPELHAARRAEPALTVGGAS